MDDLDDILHGDPGAGINDTEGSSDSNIVAILFKEGMGGE
jgi:hypothetical protein